MVVSDWAQKWPSKAPTLVICGDRDPYLNYARLSDSLYRLPEGSALSVIPGGAHMLMLEAPYYRAFQDRVVRFLLGTQDGGSDR